jgi:hypothetical protein
VCVCVCVCVCVFIFTTSITASWLEKDDCRDYSARLEESKTGNKACRFRSAIDVELVERRLCRPSSYFGPKRLLVDFGTTRECGVFGIVCQGPLRASTTTAK